MGEVLTNAELVAAGNRFAHVLDATSTPLRGGVAVLTGNVPEYLAAYRGATWSGRRFTPMSWRWAPDEVTYVVGNCEADVLVVEASHAPLAKATAELVPDERRFAVGGPIPGFRDWSEVEALSDDPLEKPTAGSTMLYTSGTTSPLAVATVKASLRQAPDISVAEAIEQEATDQAACSASPEFRQTLRERQR